MLFMSCMLTDTRFQMKTLQTLLNTLYGSVSIPLVSPVSRGPDFILCLRFASPPTLSL